MARSPRSAATGERDDLDDVVRLRLAIVRLGRRQRQEAGTGLTPSLQSALAVIDHIGSMTLGELAAVEQVSAPTTTRLVDKLQEMGLVTREPDPDDRRVTRVSITDTGHKQLEESRERRDAWLRSRVDALDPADAEALLAAIVPLERLLDVEDPAGSETSGADPGSRG
jgi:DNA-binding MarR family transcriptional regulator